MKPRHVVDQRGAGPTLTPPQRTPERWHAILGGLRQQMEKDAGKVNQLKKKRDWEQTHPGKRYPPHLDAAYGSWEYFCYAGQLLLTVTHRKLVARLSLGSYKRGLSLLNTICHQAEQRGYSVSMVQGEERLRLSRDGAYVHLRVTEKLLPGIRYRVNSWDKSRQPVRALTPTGNLRCLSSNKARGRQSSPTAQTNCWRTSFIRFSRPSTIGTRGHWQESPNGQDGSRKRKRQKSEDWRRNGSERTHRGRRRRRTSAVRHFFQKSRIGSAPCTWIEVALC